MKSSLLINLKSASTVYSSLVTNSIQSQLFFAQFPQNVSREMEFNVFQLEIHPKSFAYKDVYRLYRVL